MKVLGGVPVLRGVAAPHMPAGEAEAQAHPAIACLEAIFAAVCVWSDLLYLIEMCTLLRSHRFPLKGLVNDVAAHHRTELASARSGKKLCFGSRDVPIIVPIIKCAMAYKLRVSLGHCVLYKMKERWHASALLPLWIPPLGSRPLDGNENRIVFARWHSEGRGRGNPSSAVPPVSVGPASGPSGRVSAHQSPTLSAAPQA